MISAIVLIQTEQGRTNDVAELLVDLTEVSEVFSVGGSYDLVAILRVKEYEEIAKAVTEKMAAIDGIEKTETLPAFKVYSRHDLEAVFSIGM